LCSAIGPRSRYASLPSPPHCPLSHRPQRLHRFLVAGTGEGDQRRGGEPCLLDRGRGVFVQVALQPAGGDPRMPGWILPRNQQRQVERIPKAELR
jgi:hypothetical protein